MSESLIPLSLCLLSAITLALTNFLVKKGGDVLATRVVLSVSMGLTVLPFAFFVPLPRGPLWLAVAASVAVHWIYQFAMIRALHRGDLSLVFPVMRGLAPLLAAVFAAMALQEYPSLIGWAGLVAATAALIVFAMPENTGQTTTPLKREALFWAAITALGIALYSVVDAWGIRQASEPLTFVIWLFLFDWVGITSVFLLTRRGRVIETVRPHIRGGVMGGLLGSVSYGAALYAFTLTEAAAVTAMRETSVVFGALLGAVFLKEPFGRRRIIAAAILATGLLLLEIGL